MKHYKHQLIIAALFTTTTFISPHQKLLAQIIPDHTLNTENSIVTPTNLSTDEITGGATRGNNLFHSFEKFNIDLNKTAIFLNPLGVENILTRITGNNISQILGTLQVNGQANFYLINPNGIFFGNTAKLNIQGSFISTTADEIKLGDNGLFSAKHPENSNLLNIQPSALFINALSNQQANIENQGNLSVGKNLTLFSSNIHNTGKLSAPNGTIQLTASENLIARGNLTANTLFLDTKDLIIGENNTATIYKSTLQQLSGNTNLILQASNNITIQPLTNSTLTFAPGNGNIQLIANANFLMNTGNTIKTNGRTISISGENLTLGNINTSATNSTNSGNIFLTANSNINTENLDTSSEIEETHAGNITINAGKNIQTKTLSSYTYSEDTIVGNAGNITLNSGGNITTQDILSYTYSDFENAGNGGNISLNSHGYISTKYIDSDSYSGLGNAGNGGNINFIAQDYISTSSIYSYSFANENTGNAGNINLKSGSNISIFSLDASTESNIGNTGTSGNISINGTQGNILITDINAYSKSRRGNTATGGNINIKAGINISVDNLKTYSFSEFNNADNAGNINFNAGGYIATKGIESYSQSYFQNAKNGGSIDFTAIGNITIQKINSEALATSGNVGSGGNIKVVSHNGNLDLKDLDSSSYSANQNSGNGGEVYLKSAGNIDIQKLQTDSYSNFKNAGNAGNITLNAQNNISTIDIESYSQSDQGNAGNGGKIYLDAGGNIDTQNILSRSLSGDKFNTGNSGNGGDIFIKSTGNIFAQNIFADSYSPAGNSGNGGNINIFTQGNITTQSWKSSSYSNNDTAGNGGNINLNITNGIVNIPYLEAGVYGNANSGNAGKITLLGNSLNLNNIVIKSDSITNAGEIKLAAEIIKLTNTDISSTSLGNGSPGKIYFQSSGNILLNNSRLFTALEPGSSGNGGNIEIDANSLSLINFALIDTGTYSIGNAGDVKINAENIFLDNDSSIRSLTTSSGNAGNINLNINQSILLQNSSSISTAATSQSSGNSGNIVFKTNNLTLTTGSQLQALTSGIGKAGDIFINAGEDININGQSNNGFISGIFTSSEGLNSGEGGKIYVTTKNILLTNGGVFNAQTFSKSDGGSITIDANNITLNNGGQLLTNTFGEGKAGEIKVNATNSIDIQGNNYNSKQNLQSYQLYRQNVRVIDPFQINKIEPNNQILTAQKIHDNQFTINNPSRKNPDAEFATRVPYVSIKASGNNTTDIYSFDVNAGTRGVFDIDQTGVDLENVNEQDITLPAINTKLTLLDSQGNILATNDNNTHALGAGGSGVSMNEQLDPYLRYTFTHTDTYYIQVSNFDDHGIPSSYNFLGTNKPTSYNLQLSLETPPIQASITNGESISGIFANTQNAGKAGDITLNTPQLNIYNNGEISAKSRGSGEGGNINVNANNLTIRNGGKLLTNTGSTAKAGNMNIKVRDNITLDGTQTGLFANTEKGSTGDSGSINIDPEIFIIKNGAGIGVNSQGSGKGGNISLQAGTLILDKNAFINAETASNQGGEINLQVQKLLLLRNNSKITATAGTDGAGGNGGNININSPLIVAVPNENSDITANAFEGQGGNISITTKAIFGLQYRPHLTPKSDITASSEFGIAGDVEINTPDVNPTSGLLELPTNLVDAESLVGSNVCAYDKIEKNKFVIMGKGGLPANSEELISNSPGIIEWQNRNDKLENIPVVIKNESMSLKNRVVKQAQGWVVTNNGKVILTAETPQVTMQNAGFNNPGCK